MSYMFTLRVDHNNTYIQGYAPYGLIDAATSYLPHGYWFNPHYRKGRTDGRKRFLTKSRGSNPAHFPSGLLARVVESLRKDNVDFAIDDVREFDFHVPSLCLLDQKQSDGLIHLDQFPYDYQGEAVEALLSSGRGILEAGTGSGKTECLAAVVQSIDERSLWLENRIHLARQTQERLCARLGCDIGFIGDKECRLEKITVGMVQSVSNMLRKLGPEPDFLRSAKCLVGDECHHLTSNEWFDIFRQISAPYRFGMTATVNEGDPRMWLEAATGPVVYSIGYNELIERGIINPPRIWFVDITEPTLHKKMPWRDAYASGVLFNNHRNELARSIVWQLVQDKKPCLVLVCRVAHCKQFNQLLCNSGLKSQYITGQVPVEKRRQHLAGLSEGTVDAVVAMSSIMGEGIDVGDIRAVVNLTGLKGATDGNDKTGGRNTIQILGRGLRLSKGNEFLPPKKYLDYVDFLDLTHPDLKKASECRLETLVAVGHGNRIQRWSSYKE